MIKTCQRADLNKKLGNQVLDHMPVHIGQSIVPPLKTVSQLFMIKPEQMHPGGLKVMHMYGILGDIEAELIGCSMDMTTLHATPCHDHGEAIRIMITPK